MNKAKSDNYPILVVEDDEALRDSFEMALSYAGYSTETAQNGEAALEKTALTRHALIILDILMPVMDGVEFLKQFKNPYDIPIIALSNLDAKADIETIIRLGAKKYYLKSAITPTELITLVRNNL